MICFGRTTFNKPIVIYLWACLIAMTPTADYFHFMTCNQSNQESFNTSNSYFFYLWNCIWHILSYMICGYNPPSRFMTLQWGWFFQWLNAGSSCFGGRSIRTSLAEIRFWCLPTMVHRSKRANGPTSHHGWTPTSEIDLNIWELEAKPASKFAVRWIPWIRCHPKKSEEKPINVHPKWPSFSPYKLWMNKPFSPYWIMFNGKTSCSPYKLSIEVYPIASQWSPVIPSGPQSIHLSNLTALEGHGAPINPSRDASRPRRNASKKEWIYSWIKFMKHLWINKWDSAASFFRAGPKVV